MFEFGIRSCHFQVVGWTTGEGLFLGFYSIIKGEGGALEAFCMLLFSGMTLKWGIGDREMRVSTSVILQLAWGLVWCNMVSFPEFR